MQRRPAPWDQTPPAPARFPQRPPVRPSLRKSGGVTESLRCGTGMRLPSDIVQACIAYAPQAGVEPACHLTVVQTETGGRPRARSWASLGRTPSGPSNWKGRTPA